MAEALKNSVSLKAVNHYWQGKNIPQQWYSNKDPLTLPFFNELSFKRFELYYRYLKDSAEFTYHRGEKVLEVGCGAGTDLIEYAKNGAIVYGVDLGQDQIEMTKTNFELHQLQYEYLNVGNAESLIFASGTFDLVYSFGVLHHTPNTQKAIDEVYRVLANDGTAIVMLYARGWKHYIKRCLIQGIFKGRLFVHRFNWQKVYDEASEVHGFSPKTGVYTKKQVRALFSQFADVSIEKKRMGEFFEYAPYATVKLPKFILSIMNFFAAESWFGENWLIRAQKRKNVHKGSVKDVLFKHY